jgi:hypothetical protein
MRLHGKSVIFATLLSLTVSSKTVIADSVAVNGCGEADRGYIPIAVGDILLFGYENSKQTIVPADGKVVIPLAGELQVLAQTPNHLAEQVRERLSKYINKSAVQIDVEDDGEQNHGCLHEPETVIEALDYLGVIPKLENDYKARFPWRQILRFNFKEARKDGQIIMIETGDPIYRPLYMKKRGLKSFTIDGKLIR